MAKEGYASVTIRSDIYKMAEDDASSENRSVTNYIKHLIIQEHHFKQKHNQLKEDERRGAR